jgi:hypothetical protein
MQTRGPRVLFDFLQYRIWSSCEFPSVRNEDWYEIFNSATRFGLKIRILSEK